MVGIGTGRTDNSWFSFEMKENRTHFVNELKLKSNNQGSEDIGQVGYWSWFFEANVNPREPRLESNRSCATTSASMINDQGQKWVWDSFILHQRSSLRLRFATRQCDEQVSLVRVCTLNIFGEPVWTNINEDEVQLYEIASSLSASATEAPLIQEQIDEVMSMSTETFWQYPQFGVGMLGKVVNAITMLDDEDKLRQNLLDVAQKMNDYLMNVLNVPMETANQFAHIVSNVTMIESDDPALFAQSGSLYVNTVEQLGMKIEMTEEESFVFAAERFNLNVTRLSNVTSQRRRRDSEDTITCQSENSL